MEEEVRDAVFGNVGTTVVFRVGPFDAEVLETIFMPRFTKEDVVVLDRRQVYLTLMIDGVGSAPFSAVTIPPIEPPPVSYREQVIAASRTQFTAPRAGVENTIIEELVASGYSEAPPDARMRKKPVHRAPAQRMEPKPLSMSPEPSDWRMSPNPPAYRAAESTKPFIPRAANVPAAREQIKKPISYPMSAHPTSLIKSAEQFTARGAPASGGKSAEDLKSILRTMTAQSGAEKEQKKSQNQQSLKGVLNDVLTRSGQSTKNIQQSEKPKQSAASTFTSRVLSPPPVREGLPDPTPTGEKKPFEVSEDALRKVFKDET